MSEREIPRRWSRRAEAELLRLHKEGLSRDQIAKLLNRTPDAVKIRLNRVKVRHDAEQETGSTTRRPTAYTKAPLAEARAKAKARRCLSCDAAFRSEGPHNRLCAKCRSHTEGPAEYALRVRR